MFSPITIPSSTKIPITIIIPKSDNTLMVTLNCAAKINIPKKATGKPKATQIAKRKFKNNAKKKSTNRIPTTPFSINNFVLPFNVIEASLETFN